MKKISLLLSAVALLALSSCSNEDEPIGAVNPSNQINVTTEVSTLKLRAGYTTETLREFGLIIASGNEDYTYNNKRMTGGPLEGWSTDETMYWESQNSNHTIIAYAPYKDATLDKDSKIDVKVSTDQSTADAVLASDFIAMKKSAFVPATDLTEGQLLVKMDHLLSKIFIKLTYPEVYANIDGSNPVSDITVGGMKVDATFDFAVWDGMQTTAALALNGNGSIEDIAPYELSHDAENRQVIYEFIAVPQEQASISVTFKAGGIPYTWKYDNLKTNSGEAITITLSVDKQGVSMGEGVTVGEWTEGSGINGGNPSEGAEPYTIEELKDKENWSLVYGTPRVYWNLPFQSDNIAFDGSTGGDVWHAWFSHSCGPQNPRFGEGYKDIYFVLDLGKARWLSGFSAVTAGYTDTTFETVEFYITSDETISTDGLDDENYNLMKGVATSDEENNEEFRGKMRAAIDKANAIDAGVSWVKLGEVNSNSVAPPVCYDGNIDHANLEQVVKSQYVKVVIKPYTEDAPGVVLGDRASLAEIYLRYVVKHNGEIVE